MPLTPTQRDLYPHHARHPSSTRHLLGDSCRLDADLRSDLWLRAVETVLAREPSTRTRLVVLDGEVRQELCEPAPGCRVIDLATEPSDVTSAEEYIERDRQRPFDLFRLPLWRSYLVRDRDGAYVAGLLAPHIFADGRSYRPLFERIGREYERLVVMEHFDPALYRHNGPLLLLYGRESHLRGYRAFGWPHAGWADRFAVTPAVQLVPGEHGRFFIDPENLGPLAATLESFL